MLADKRYAMALQLAEWGDHTAAADLLRQGIELAPAWPPFYFHLGETLRQGGNADSAARAFHDYLARDPADAMGATIKLSLMGAVPMPPSMPEEYVRSLFHQYAPKFERSLVENLQYHTPDLMADMVFAHHPDGFENLLDLGCGTGLAAKFYAGRAVRMTGIDLAPGMVEQAKRKNIYAVLHVGKIEDFLAQTPERYDIALAADVFVYIGALEEIFARLSAVLMPAGIFSFSVQMPADDVSGWVLGPDHRYAHARAYIESSAAKAGFTVLDCRENIALRLDGGKAVLGAIYLLRIKDV